MKKSIITIDLTKLDLDDFSINQLELIENAKVEQPCTLTDAVDWCEKYCESLSIYGDKTLEVSDSNKYIDVETFKREHLYKEEVLEDGWYLHGCNGDVCAVKNGECYANTWAIGKNDPFKKTSDLINPIKIADL